MDSWQDEFPLESGVHYLNHAAVAPWPKRARDAVCAFADENLRLGARDYPGWLTVEKRLRAQLCDLIGAVSADDVALLKNTSEGLSLIAFGLDWQPGDKIVITNQEFPSNRIPWEALARHGVEMVAVDVAGDDPEAQLVQALEKHRPRLLSVSSVQYGSGLRLDMSRLGAACQRLGILFCVDAIQSLGVVPFDVTKTQADFVVADGHKWMLGPEGLALFWCRPALREELQLHQYGWHMVARAGDFDAPDWQPSSTATRFECGSPNLLAAHALSASLSLLHEVGIPRIEELINERVAYLDDGLKRRGMQILTPEARAGILTFRPERDGPEHVDELFQRLWHAGVVCAKRGGGIRFSPHFYTRQETLDVALSIVRGTSE